MINFFTHITEKHFKILTIIGCFFADLSTVFWISQKKAQFLDLYFKILKERVALENPNIIIPQAARDEIFQLMGMSITIMSVGFILAHSLIYITFYFKKPFSIGYLKIYTSTAAIGSLIGLISEVKEFYFFAPMTLWFAFAALGLFKRKGLQTSHAQGLSIQEDHE